MNSKPDTPAKGLSQDRSKAGKSADSDVTSLVVPALESVARNDSWGAVKDPAAAISAAEAMSPEVFAPAAKKLAEPRNKLTLSRSSVARSLTQLHEGLEATYGLCQEYRDRLEVLVAIALAEKIAFNKRALESLVKAGCLDSVAGTSEARGAMLVNVDRILGIAQSALKLKETGQTTMFDLFGEEVATPLAGLHLEGAPARLVDDGSRQPQRRQERPTAPVGQDQDGQEAEPVTQRRQRLRPPQPEERGRAEDPLESSAPVVRVQGGCRAPLRDHQIQITVVVDVFHRRLKSRCAGKIDRTDVDRCRVEAAIRDV